LVVGADTLSRITDYTDQTTCILFGNGAGAFVVSRSEEHQSKRIIYSTIHIDGTHMDALYIPGGGSREPDAKSKIVMGGRKIFKLAVKAMTKTVQETLEATGCTVEEIDWVIPHQANQRIIDSTAKNLGLPEEKVISTIQYFGNNSAATIPLAFDIAVKDGRIKRGNHIVLTAFGGGLVWGSLLMEY
jgi:3-oxoacyl-[acyl-carrier-protein] synthase III